jgi:xanthine dehydrogenase accessory factor
MTAAVLVWTLSRLDQGHSVVLASVISTSGSVPGKVGAKLALSGFDEHEQWVGTVGGAGLEMKVLQRCRELLKQSSKPSGEVLTYGLHKGAKGYQVTPLDSLCGGRVTLAIEVIIAMPHVLLMGAGHCAKALVNGFQSLGWSYSIHDTRTNFVSSEEFVNSKELHCSSVKSFFSGDEHKEAETKQSLSRFSDILLLGHDWTEDQERLISLLTILESKGEIDSNSKPRIGVIGSRSKWQSFESECLKAGVSQQSLNEIQCPIGINIGAETPEEIAVAVIAQILSSHKGVDHSQPTWRENKS